MDFVEDSLLLLCLLKKKKKRPRRFWVHPLLFPRQEKGLHHTLYDDLRDHDDKFFVHFRMKKSSFDELLSRIQEDLRKEDTHLRKSIPPDEKLALTLRYLGQGCSMTDLHITYRLGLSTVSGIIRNVLDALWNWRKDCFPEITTDSLDSVARRFEDTANFPHCIGAVDGKHIRIVKPEHSGSDFYNYKHFFSLQLMAVCDIDYRFLFIDVGAKGKETDSTVFKNSKFYKKLENGEIKLPNSKPLTGQSVSSPYVLVGDEGFGISPFMLRPYAGAFLPLKKKVFNYRLSRARRVIECAFGILANKWSILHRPLNVQLELAELIVKVCCRLHNFVLERDGYRFPDTLSIEGLGDLPRDTSQGSKNANTMRDIFANYFMSPEGEVPWQLSKV